LAHLQLIEAAAGMAQLQQELAMDRPLKLGSTIAGDGSIPDGYFTFKYDFQPDGMQRAQQADLLLFGEQQEQVGAHPGASSDSRLS
jgi:hypothetical protein